MPIEIDDLHFKMVIFQFANCNKLPEGNYYELGYGAPITPITMVDYHHIHGSAPPSDQWTNIIQPENHRQKLNIFTRCGDLFFFWFLQPIFIQSPIVSWVNRFFDGLFMIIPPFFRQSQVLVRYDPKRLHLAASLDLHIADAQLREGPMETGEILKGHLCKLIVGSSQKCCDLRSI